MQTSACDEDDEQLDIESAFKVAQRLLDDRALGGADTLEGIKRAHTKCVADWVKRQLDMGVLLVPDSSHTCIDACIMVLIDDHKSHPLYVCKATGVSHACGNMCSVKSIIQDETGEAFCPLSALTLECGVLSSGWAGETEYAPPARTDHRATLRKTRNELAVETEMQAACQAVRVHGVVGIGTTKSANDMVCGLSRGAWVMRAKQAPARPKSGVYKKHRERRDPVFSGTNGCRRSLASVVIMRLLASGARAEVEERKMVMWYNDCRKALSRYNVAKKGEWRCIGHMTNICVATIKKRVIDGIFIGSREFENIVRVYSLGFESFLFILSGFAERDIVEGTRITEEYVAAYLYMLSEGIYHDGVAIVQRDLFMKAFLPEPSSIDMFGIDKSSYTNARNVIWKILFDRVRASETPHDACIPPIVI